MDLSQRKNALAALGQRLEYLDAQELDNLALQAVNENNWFTKQQITSAINAWANSLTDNKIDHWLGEYREPSQLKAVGIVMAGNIPLVGLHDLLSILVAGHKALVKLSSQDKKLMEFMIRSLIHIEPSFAERIEIVEQLKTAEAVIATGSDNTARYFKQYFGNKPNIIRKNRTSIAVINGHEGAEAIYELGKDIFTYYGLGCRNVSKLFVPKGASLTQLIDGLMPYEEIIDHHKYRNNYDYNKSIYLVNGEDHLDSGFFLMRATEELVSPISVVYYEAYDNEAALALKLSTISDKTQCIVSDKAWYPNSLNFGEAQCPELWDYADGVNTLDFLMHLD